MRCWGWVLISALALTPAFAHAQDSSSSGETEDTLGPPTAEQKKLFSDARGAYKNGKFAEALPKFQQITAETKSPNARLYVARCLKELKRTAEAYDTLRSIVEQSGHDPKYEKTRSAAAADLQELEPLVAHLTITLTPEQKGSAVNINGTPVLEDRFSSVTVEPGTLDIELFRTGSTPEHQTIEVQAGDHKSVAFAPKTEPPPLPPISEKPKGLGTVRIAGIAIGSVGVVSLLAGIGTGIASGTKFDEVQSACGGKRCTDPKFADDIDAGKSLESAADATFVIGGVFVAASIPMIILGGPKISLHPTTGGAFVSLSNDF